MADLSPTNASPSNAPSTTAGLGGLIAIVVAIILGVIVGLTYGRSMWIAGGGPAEEIVQLEATILQKEARAAEIEADDPAEAARLRGHIPLIEGRLPQLRQHVKNQPASFGMPLVAWEFTKFCGEMFLQALRMLVVPLVVTSMICGITSLGDVRKLGKIGGWTLFYYLSTASAAVLLGIVLVQIIQPGTDTDDTFAYVTESVQAKQAMSPVETLLNVFRGRPGEPASGMVPSNIFLAAAETNVLGLIGFAIVFGACLTLLGEQGKVVVDFFQGANEAIMKMVHLVMWLAPLGIFGLVAWNIAKKGGGAAFGAELSKLGLYVGTVSLGLVLHTVLLCVLLWLFTRRNPLAYMFGMSRALLTAVTTSSSSATLPITMQCVEENNSVSPKSAGFVLPLGATINMDGTALYEAVAVIFIAQSLGIELSIGALIVIFLTATLAAIGAAGIPEAGLVTMVIVLTAVGLPISGIGLILAIDWFLDRLRTTVNVFGDSVGAGIIDHYVEPA